MTSDYEQVYYNGLLDDLHNFFPAFLYEPTRFSSVPDVMRYVQTQMTEHFNIFNRARRQYQEHNPFTTIPMRHMTTTVPPPIGPTPTPNHRPRVGFGLTTETIDLTPLFTTNLTRQTTGGGLGARVPGGDLEEIAAEFGIPTMLGGAAGGGGILNQLTNLLTRAAEPVVVAPTAQQIERATTIRVSDSSDEDENQSCAICQEPLVDEEANRPLREITLCEHTFHQACIDRWFTRNVRCPVCRFDIRDHETPTQSP
jgi:hypothetical protein